MSFVVTIADVGLELTYDLKPGNEPPSTTMLWQIAFFFIANEVGFYFAHRLIHHPSLYWIHKKHHSYNSTIALAAQYCHPIEMVLANNLPTGIGIKILSFFYPVHIYTIIIWFTFRVVETNDGHCGYDWPWAQAELLPLSAGGNYHAFHHSRNSGNYGAMIHFIDTLLGTNEDYDKELTKIAEQKVK